MFIPPRSMPIINPPLELSSINVGFLPPEDPPTPASLTVLILKKCSTTRETVGELVFVTLRMSARDIEDSFSIISKIINLFIFLIKVGLTISCSF